MKTEHPKPFLVRLFAADIKIINRAARKAKVSKAEIIRRAIAGIQI